LVDYTLSFDWSTAFKAFLDDVIAVLVLHHIDDVVLELLNERILLLVDVSQVVQSLLDNTTAERIVRKLAYSTLDDFQYALFVFIETNLKNLLEHVVAELVFDES